MIYKKTIPWSSSSNNKPGEPSGLNAVPQMMVTKIRNTYGGKNPQHRKKNLQEKNMKKVSSAKGPNLKLRGSDDIIHQWALANLKDGGSFLLNWPQMFGFTIDLLWQQRNAKVLKDKKQMEQEGYYGLAT
ncbi:hypothetical protein JHK82_022315 [Glycine max]|nr:hypothetical protein JHK85_022800 [Glycine max]KAG5026423.1 hypothetical protein JHK86_022337 [Glycine max]KAG5137584.1 hypothetical protein JHK82_022315 [Glycine max]